MLHHVEERFEHSRREGHGRPIQLPQDPFRRVEPKIAEFVNVSGCSLHRRFQNNSEKFIRDLKTFINAPGIFSPRARGSRLPREENTINHM